MTDLEQITADMTTEAIIEAMNRICPNHDTKFTPEEREAWMRLNKELWSRRSQ